MWYAVVAVIVAYIVGSLLHARSVATRDRWESRGWALNFYWKWLSDTGAARKRRTELPKEIGAVILAIAVVVGIFSFLGYAAVSIWYAPQEARIEQWQKSVPPPLAPGATAEERTAHEAAMKDWLAHDPRTKPAEQSK